MKHQRYLLDTNICAFWLRDKFGIKYRVNEVGMENCYISEITVAELIYGREYGKLKGGPKYRDEKLEQFFEGGHQRIARCSRIRAIRHRESTATLGRYTDR